MQEMDMPVHMQAIMAKLPFRMREQWRTVAQDIMGNTHETAHFWDLVAFIEWRVSILSDPLFGNIQDPTSGVVGTRFPSYSSNRAKENIVATTIASTDLSDRGEELISLTANSVNIKEVLCLYCRHGHSLEDCQQFKERTHKDKLQVLRERGACFACLCVGHISRFCEG